MTEPYNDTELLDLLSDEDWPTVESDVDKSKSMKIRVTFARLMNDVAEARLVARTMAQWMRTADVENVTIEADKAADTAMSYPHGGR